MSPFEIIMLICFGLAWPFSIYKSWKTKAVGSKSFTFLLALLIGYIAGIMHKLLFAYDGVIFLYILNGAMVTADMGLYIRNKRYWSLSAQNRYFVGAECSFDVLAAKPESD